LDHEAAAALLAPVLEGALGELTVLSTADLLNQRYERLRHMGQFFAAPEL
jgi:acetyl-CoA carboxylase alpha subunit